MSICDQLRPVACAVLYMRQEAEGQLQGQVIGLQGLTKS